MFKNISLLKTEEIENFNFSPYSTYLFLIGEACKLNPLVLYHTQAQVCSVVVPAVICNNLLYSDAILACELEEKTNILYCQSEKDAPINALNLSQSALVFMDWMDAKIYNYLDKLFSLTNENISILGAGCGRTTMNNETIITCNGVSKTNGFLILFSEKKMHLGAQHGSLFHHGYYTVKTHNNNTLETINAEPASTFYIKMIQTLFNETVTEENIFEMGLKYPLGLGGTGGEQPLRVPASIQGSHLILAGPIENESVISFMYSKPEQLKIACYNAIQSALTTVDSLSDKECFLVECLGRKMLLGTQFDTELTEISRQLEGIKRIYGILSLGEIANNANHYIEYFNEVCALGIFDATQ